MLFRWVPVVVVLALVGSSYAVVEWNLGERWLGIERADPQENPAAVAPPSGLVLPSPVAAGPVAEPLVPAAADPAAVRRAVARALTDPDLGPRVAALVGDGFASGPPMVMPASSLKLLTATAALAALGPATTFSTRVVAGPRPGDIVLVGGGDPYLVSAPDPDAPAVAPRPADLVTLARLTAAALRAERSPAKVRLFLDDTLFSGPAVNPHWPDDYVPDSVVTPISALMVDHGLLEDGFHRAADPAARAATLFAKALGREGLTVRSMGRSVAPDAAAELASVESAPLDQVVERVLSTSDNEGSEILLRHVGLHGWGVGSFTGGIRAQARILAGLGVTLAGARLFDGSGLSRDNLVPPRALLEVLQLALDPARPELSAVIEGLPVAAFSGTLDDRFTTGSAAGRGWVRAKTGTLTGVSALAGIVQTVDGVLLPFVIAADRIDPEDTLDARDALDRAASALAACHCAT